MDNQDKSTTQNESMLKLSNAIDLTINKKVKKVKIGKTKEKTDSKLSNKRRSESVIDFNRFLKSQPSSVQTYLNECHSDVTKFIQEHGATSIKGEPGKLIILTQSKLRIEITDVDVRERRVLITNRKGDKLFDGNTKLLNQQPTK